MQPSRERRRLSPLNLVRLVGQDQERGLEYVFRFVFIAKDSPANTEHHRRVTRDQLGEGRLPLLNDKSSQQFTVTCWLRLLVLVLVLLAVRRKPLFCTGWKK